MIRVLKTADVAKILGTSLVTARNIMNREDFPLILAGKNYSVEEEAFYDWLKKRHVKEEKRKEN